MNVFVDCALHFASYSISQQLWAREASLYTKAAYFGSGTVAASVVKGSGRAVHLFGGCVEMKFLLMKVFIYIVYLLYV